MSVKKNLDSNKTGRPWKNESFHNTFQQADENRQKLLAIWSSDPQHKGMEVKVKFMSSKKQYVVKTRRPIEISKKEKKSGNGQ